MKFSKKNSKIFKIGTQTVQVHETFELDFKECKYKINGDCLTRLSFRHTQCFVYSAYCLVEWIIYYGGLIFFLLIYDSFRLTFSNLGMSLYRGRFYYCETPTNFEIGKIEVKIMKKPPINFLKIFYFNN